MRQPKRKQCKRCGKPKPLSEFYRHPSNSDGVGSACKECVKEAMRQLRDSNIEEHRRRDRKRYYEQPHRREQAQRSYQNTPLEKRNEYKYRWIKANPEKRAAHTAVSNALRAGRLVRQPCEHCGKKAQAHHDDYSKPLEVRWLCATCHAEGHRKG